MHLGRRDQIVNVGGTRVSVAEVEAALGGVPGVEDGCVLVDDAWEWRTRLLGVVTAKTALRSKDILAVLRKRLEPSGVPVLFYQVPDFPRLPGGKVDRRELLAGLRGLTPLREGPAQPASDRLEVQLIAIWRDVLRMSELGATDSLFDLGADSLTTVELQTRLGQLEISVTPQELLQHPTPRALATHVRARAAGGSFPAASPVILLRPGQDRRCLVLLPGAGSGALSLVHLAQSLTDGVTVYGLQYPGLDGDDDYRLTVEGLAAYLLDHLDRRLAGRPFGLAGTSFGGMVAFEMARRLELAGRDLLFLGLIDTYAPGYLDRRPRSSLASRVEATTRSWLPVGARHDLRLGNLVSGLRQKWRFRAAERWLKSPQIHPRPHERRYEYLTAACLTASRAYHVCPIQTKIHFFSVEEQLPVHVYEPDETLGWSRASTGGVEVTQIPGRHGTHLHPPHVESFGRRLTRAFVSATHGAFE